MDDFAFYNAVEDAPRGWKRALVPARRLSRRLLRPYFLRLAEILADLSRRIDATEKGTRDLHARLDHTSDQLQETIAFGWDYAAMTRRLAALEDRVEALQSLLPGDVDRPTLAFQDPEAAVPRAQAS